MTPAEKFLNEIAGELKTQPGYNIREEVFFPLRYAKNRPVAVQHRTIAEKLMPEDPRLGPGDYEASIGTTSQNVLRAIVNKYKEEMTADGVDVKIFLNGQRGQGGIWRTAYEWLWEQKYRRWLEANSWELLREKAKSPANWIQFLTEEDKQKVLAGETRVRRPSRPASVEKITEKIPVNQPLYLEVNLEYPQHRLLLVNGNTEGQYLFCPSLDFAPDSILENPPFVLPQAGSWAEQNGENEKILFEDVRREEFMAIVLDKDVNFDWMKPSEEESLPEWTGQRILDVFKQLEQSGEWQVFYQSFEVVESETKADKVDSAQNQS
jgi:hypothetical protein